MPKTKKSKKESSSDSDSGPDDVSVRYRQEHNLFLAFFSRFFFRELQRKRRNGMMKKTPGNWAVSASSNYQSSKANGTLT